MKDLFKLLLGVLASLFKSRSTRTKRKAIANIQQSCSDSPEFANPMDGVFGTDSHIGGSNVAERIGIMSATVQWWYKNLYAFSAFRILSKDSRQTTPPDRLVTQNPA